MAVKAVASVVIQKLTDMLTQESVMNERGLKNELQLIKSAIESMGGYFLDAEAESKRSDARFKGWTENCLRHLYSVEDAIEAFALRFPCSPRWKTTSKITFGLAFLKNYNLCRKIKKIRHQIDELNRTRPLGLEDVSVKSTSSYPFQITNNNNNNIGDLSLSNGHHHDEEETPTAVADHQLTPTAEEEKEVEEDQQEDDPNGRGLRAKSDASILAERINQSKFMFNYSFDGEKLPIVGFEQNVRTLAQALANGSGFVVSVVGERGSGKTTLARAVYGNSLVKHHFKSCSAWVTAAAASRGSSATTKATPELLLNLLTQITSGSKDQQGGEYSFLLSSNTDRLKARIREELLKHHSNYLIVLEDVESSGMWDDLQTAFPSQHQQSGSGNNNKILLITSEEAVATHANSQVHQLEKLNTSDTWNLFLRKSGLHEPAINGDLKPIILQVCNQLPLNIVLLGSLLSTKQVNKWPETLNSQAANSLDLISLSYDDLPAHLKLCLIYMLLFPKGFDIPVRRLQRLWLAEGFVTRSESPGIIFQEDVVKGYFDELVKRSLIQVSKLTSDGSPKRCRLLGVIHDHLIPKAQVIRLFHVHDSRNSRDSFQVADPVFVRRLVEYTDIKTCPSELASLRSYLSFNIQKKDIPATGVGKLLSSILSNGLRLLRVLDLEGVYKPSLPDNLGDFFHLRYLGLRWTFLYTLPESIGRLYYLETLDIKHTYISTLPPYIWKMKHLKHLNANGIHLELPAHSCSSSLPQLMTLSGFSVDDKSLKKNSCLKSLVHIRELEITFQLSSSEELLGWISKLTAIQALRLRSKDDTGRPSMIRLKPLSSLNQLTHLNLLGNLPKLPNKVDFPQELKVLTLSVSLLKEDPMPTLGGLPNLTVLRLLAKSYLGNTMICQAGGFKELRVLKLWMLKKLEHWDVEKGAMKKLRELNIRCCDKLKMIPSKLLEQINELTLTNMSPDFRSRVEKTKSSHVSVTINKYNFTPLPWEEDDGSSDIEVNSISSNGYIEN